MVGLKKYERSNLESVVVTLPVNGYSEIQDPYYEEVKHCSAFVTIKDLVGSFPMGPNPRNQNLNTKTSKAIRDSITSPLGFMDFHTKSRGITLLAKEIVFNEKQNEITILFEDPAIHGCIDGGHLYKISLEQIDNLVKTNIDPYVRLEIMTGVSENKITAIAMARNSINPTTKETIANHCGAYDLFKDTLRSEPYFNKIAFVQNDEAEKTIKIKDIVVLSKAFDIGMYDTEMQPSMIYSNSGTISENYIKVCDAKRDNKSKVAINHYDKVQSILPDIIELYDKVQEYMSKYFTKKRTSLTGTNKTTKKEHKTKYYENKMPRSVPTAVVLPIVSTFRVITQDDGDKYSWKIDPMVFFKEVIGELGKDITKMISDKKGDYHAIGKEKLVWAMLYNKALKVAEEYTEDKIDDRA